VRDIELLLPNYYQASSANLMTWEVDDKFWCEFEKCDDKLQRNSRLATFLLVACLISHSVIEMLGFCFFQKSLWT
jgi:hypothetical protein